MHIWHSNSFLSDSTRLLWVLSSLDVFLYKVLYFLRFFGGRDCWTSTWSALDCCSLGEGRIDDLLRLAGRLVLFFGCVRDAEDIIWFRAINFDSSAGLGGLAGVSQACGSVGCSP